MGSHFGGFGAPPILVGILVGIESDVHWGYGIWLLTHGHGWHWFRRVSFHVGTFVFPTRTPMGFLPFP